MAVRLNCRHGGNEMEARRTELSVAYQGKNISEEIKTYVENFSYTDKATDESDRISLILKNIDARWLDSWMPEKEDKMDASLIRYENGATEALVCGTFLIDELSFQGSPLICTIQAVSAPISSSFKSTKKKNTWNHITLKDLAAEIASNAGVSLIYDSQRTVSLSSIEQEKQTDAEFLQQLCKNYGFNRKVYSEKIILYDEEEYEKKPAVAEISQKDMQSWSYRTEIEGSYTGAKMSYTDPENGKTYEASVGGGERILELSGKADSEADAKLQAEAQLKEANRNMTTLQFTLKVPIFLTAASTVNITGLGKISGKYFLNTVKHSLSSGYKVSVTARRIPDEVDGAEEQTEEDVYIVVSGDTLWGIAKKFYGSGIKHTVIYNANQESIEETAKKHGKRSSDNGHWIWPGQKLVIPKE